MPDCNRAAAAAQQQKKKTISYSTLVHPKSARRVSSFFTLLSANLLDMAPLLILGDSELLMTPSSLSSGGGTARLLPRPRLRGNPERAFFFFFLWEGVTLRAGRPGEVVLVLVLVRLSAHEMLA